MSSVPPASPVQGHGELRPRRRPRLGPWWPPALLMLTGLAVIALGWGPVAGGTLMALGFALAAVLRWVTPEAYAGGLIVRNASLDVLTHAALAVNVLAAVLLVERVIDWPPLAVLDLGFLAAGVIILRGRRARRARGPV